MSRKIHISEWTRWNLHRALRSVSTTRVDGPSSRAELTARELGCIFWHFFDIFLYTARVHGRPVSTTRVYGPSWRVSKNAPKFSGRQLGPWTRVVETDLKSETGELHGSVQFVAAMNNCIWTARGTAAVAGRGVISTADVNNGSLNTSTTDVASMHCRRAEQVREPRTAVWHRTYEHVRSTSA